MEVGEIVFVFCLLCVVVALVMEILHRWEVRRNREWTEFWNNVNRQQYGSESPLEFVGLEDEQHERIH